ncbi:P-loop containing nucleoside triphosphate hydrolase protein [Coniophora puteana RWD-64-598 SS2]|uniref:P-loop containing nucleoside triphosphate hydrolase protein n=1 Tax=Coniophora puteana (strain RWD-64-598) TaxID=741705 RepID=A0A5M3MG80_CONPW|nr:P-loop containing nucleoside triphosphate hydrolase protein [Coniophora puteana RWD-64-598 SS2]EIW78173.1 P-loop containing nucleoside triphosphate hydrolase protein [Coniophora puteana RWD-64-598 SS2]
MDLDDYDTARLKVETEACTASTPQEALEWLDVEWFSQASRRARWMDLLGDYAGTEPFVIDGDSIVQIVLDDPLLALAKVDDPTSFQLLHAIYSIERLINDFKKRGAVFDIVFWKDHKHLSIHSGAPDQEVASRALARQLLINHLRQLQDTTVHCFENIRDAKWKEYQSLAKPMFVMINDGGLPMSDDAWNARWVLVQRKVLAELLSNGISFALLKGCEFRDSKIISFVYEARGTERWPKEINIAHKSAWAALTSAALKYPAQHLLKGYTPAQSLQPMLQNAARMYLDISRDSASVELLYAFFLHCGVTSDLSVFERAVRDQPFPVETQKTILQFYTTMFVVLEAVVSRTKTSLDIDGRVFVSVLGFLVERGDSSIDDDFGPTASTLVRNVFSSLDCGQPDFSRLRPLRFLSQQPGRLDPDPEPLDLLPFSNDVFDSELAAVHVSTSNIDVEDMYSSSPHYSGGTVFSDTHHWHAHRRALLPKHLGGEQAPRLEGWARKRQLRGDQIFMRQLQKQAGTLTGAQGYALQQITIPPVGTSKRPKQAPAPKSASSTSQVAKEKQKGGSRKATMSKADKIRADNLAKKASEATSESTKWLDGVIRESESSAPTTSPEKRLQYLRDKERSLRLQDPMTRTRFTVYELHLLFLQWIDNPARDSATTRDTYSVTIVRLLKDLRATGCSAPDVRDAVSASLGALGLSGLKDALVPAVDIGEDEKEKGKRVLGFKFVKLVSSRTGRPEHDFMSVREDAVVWQLRVFGEYMDRSMDSQPDRRVTFQPDAWQREVLDAIDEDKSLLVVAPTSAGKTFISYYAMERALRESDDGILVYVAPTKALVSQIAAEVYARFSKTMDSRSCWAIHTRDYRVHDPQNCQILITVPDVLAIMLLAPALARVWTPRLKRIIMDEIHTIGQQEGGSVWEQILLLAPCPIIGLSATIGEPERFNAWLESVQHAGGFEHKFVYHPHRYSHLRKFFYNLHGTKKVSFTSLDEHESTERMRFLHPISALDFGSRSIPSDLALEARDTLTLYRALQGCSDVSKETLEQLRPEVFFAGKAFLQQKDVICYEQSLKDVVVSLVSMSDPRDAVSPLQAVIKHLDDDQLAAMDRKLLNKQPKSEALIENLPYFVADLHAQNDLPAVFFNFERGGCVNLAKRLVKFLADKELKFREVDPGWIKKMAEWEAWRAGAKDRERAAARNKTKRVAVEDVSEASDGFADDWKKKFNPSDPLRQFSLAGHSSYSMDDLRDDIKELTRRNSVPQWAIACLLRGVAVHHAGMNKHYRSLVEALYRKGFVRVMFATGTLALGINAPTKTSVFCGDSPFLTALMYRQCAGRAGRRGYDLLGKVAFYGLSLDRVKRLILSRIPSLAAHFPITSTLVLRLFNLLEGSGHAPTAVHAIQRLFRLPRIAFASSSETMTGEGGNQLLHHLRFSIDYLRRGSLLDSTGRPLDLFGIAGQLYYTEPSNLALVALLRAGIIHRICKMKSRTDAKLSLVTLLAHLFGRRPLPGAAATEKFQEAIKKSASIVFLPPLEKAAAAALETHEEETLQVFSAYARAYAKQYSEQLGQDCELPFSRRRFEGNTESVGCAFRLSLRATAVSVTTRSAFVATSGHADTFGSVQELARTTRSGVTLNEHAIPTFGDIISHTVQKGGRKDGSHALNAYLLDFYKHGQEQALVTANGIRSGDLWYLLQDFDLTLKTIRGVLATLLTKSATGGSELDFDALDFDDGFDPAEVDDWADEAPASVAIPPVQSRKVKASKVVDSWDDEDEDSQVDPEGTEQSDTIRVASSATLGGGSSASDRQVYDLICEVLEEFEEKFRAMWA